MAPPNPVKKTAATASRIANNFVLFISILYIDMKGSRRNNAMRRNNVMGSRRSRRNNVMRRMVYRRSSRRGMMMGGRRSHGKSTMRRRGSRRCWSGGSAPVNDTSMHAASRLSLSQGGDFLSHHTNQHGGAAVSLANSAPLGYSGVLDSSMRGAAGVLPGDAAFAAASGMKDQAGGGKRVNAAHRKILKMLKKLTKKRKQRGGSPHWLVAKRPKQRGGAAYSLTQAQDVSTPGELLSGRAALAAAAGQNPEWKYVENPAAYNPSI